METAQVHTTRTCQLSKKFNRDGFCAVGVVGRSVLLGLIAERPFYEKRKKKEKKRRIRVRVRIGPHGYWFKLSIRATVPSNPSMTREEMASAVRCAGALRRLLRPIIGPVPGAPADQHRERSRRRGATWSGAPTWLWSTLASSAPVPR